MRESGIDRRPFLVVHPAALPTGVLPRAQPVRAQGEYIGLAAPTPGWRLELGGRYLHLRCAEQFSLVLARDELPGDWFDLLLERGYLEVVAPPPTTSFDDVHELARGLEALVRAQPLVGVMLHLQPPPPIDDALWIPILAGEQQALSGKSPVPLRLDRLPLHPGPAPGWSLDELGASGMGLRDLLGRYASVYEDASGTFHAAPSCEVAAPITEKRFRTLEDILPSGCPRCGLTSTSALTSLPAELAESSSKLLGALWAVHSAYRCSQASDALAAGHAVPEGWALLNECAAWESRTRTTKTYSTDAEEANFCVNAALLARRAVERLAAALRSRGDLGVERALLLADPESYATARGALSAVGPQGEEALRMLASGVLVEQTPLAQHPAVGSVIQWLDAGAMSLLGPLTVVSVKGEGGWPENAAVRLAVLRHGDCSRPHDSSVVAGVPAASAAALARVGEGKVKVLSRVWPGEGGVELRAGLGGVRSSTYSFDVERALQEARVLAARLDPDKPVGYRSLAAATTNAPAGDGGFR